MTHRLLKWLVAGATLAVLTAAAAGGAFAGSTPAAPKDGSPEFTTQGGVAPFPGMQTVPTWNFSYTDSTNGATYPITMVGSDPRLGGSTTVNTEIIPLKLNFVAGNQDMSAINALYGINAVPLTRTFDGNTDVSKVEASPIFSNYTYDADLGGDTGQFGDVFMRAQFDKIGSSYHVKLGTPNVYPTVTIDVPQNQGVAYQRAAGAEAGIANAQWFSAQINNLMNSLKIDPHTLPIFLTDNVLLYQGNKQFTNCCILGYHGAAMPIGHGAGSANGNGNNKVQTFIYAAYARPNTYSGFTTPNGTLPTRGISDIHPLSHEVSEWLDDPLVNNAVQPWITPTAPQYGCTGVLEVGDPVVGVWFPLAGNPDAAANNVWHPEDEVFLNWFARNSEPAGLSPWHTATHAPYYTFMGQRTINIGGLYSGWGSLPATC